MINSSLLRFSSANLNAGVELSGKCKSVTWPGSEEEFEPDVTVRLELRQVSPLAEV